VDSIGKRLVRSLIASPITSDIVEFGITEKDISDDALEALKFATEYRDVHKTWPTPSVVLESISVSLPDEVDELKYICDVIRKRTLGTRLSSTLTTVADLLERKDPDAALALVADTHLKLISEHSYASKAKPSSFRKDGIKSVETYVKLSSKGGLDGVPTPWDSLDRTTQGWVNGSFNVITAMTSTGKTWVASVIANDCMERGRKVLFVVLEMTVERVERRLHAIHYKIPYGDIRDGSMPLTKLEEWRKKIVDSAAKVGDILTFDKKTVRYVSDVTRLVNTYRPDIVVVDGGYRFESPTRSKGNWESTVSIVNELQMASEASGVPWVVTTQQGDSHETGKESKPGSKMNRWGVRYGKEWLINPDVVIGLRQDDDRRLTNTMEIHNLKIREATGDHVDKFFLINWDLKKMNFREFKAEKRYKGIPEDLLDTGVTF